MTKKIIKTSLDFPPSKLTQLSPKRTNFQTRGASHQLWKAAEKPGYSPHPSPKVFNKPHQPHTLLGCFHLWKITPVYRRPDPENHPPWDASRPAAASTVIRRLSVGVIICPWGPWSQTVRATEQTRRRQLTDAHWEPMESDYTEEVPTISSGISHRGSKWDLNNLNNLRTVCAEGGFTADFL